MSYFEVSKCGLYSFKESDKPVGIKLEETFDLILDWVQSRSLVDTIPWDPTQKTNSAKCYCKDIYKDSSTGDFLLVLWKSDTDSAGTLLGAREDNTGKVVKYTSSYNGKKVIWGRPCYYWIIPSKNTVISLKFDHSVCDAELFKDFVVNAINNRVKHPNKVKEKTETGLVRLAFVGSEKKRYYYSYKMNLMSMKTASSQLDKLASKITHIIRRESILVASKDDRSEWTKIFTKHIPFLAAKPKSKQRKIEIKAEAKPSKAEIVKIIKKYAVENRKPSDWNNVGFQTDKGIKWVDKFILKDYLTFSQPVEQVLTAEFLLNYIHKNRVRYIDLMKQTGS